MAVLILITFLLKRSAEAITPMDWRNSGSRRSKSKFTGSSPVWTKYLEIDTKLLVKEDSDNFKFSMATDSFELTKLSEEYSKSKENKKLESLKLHSNNYPISK